jgi:class 3 adenylate cyclase
MLPRVHPPTIEYARHDGVAIAFQVFGSGPDLLVVPGWASHLERNWELPGLAELFERLATFARVIVVDRRGSGLSDRFGTDATPTLEDHMTDLIAVIRQAAATQVSVLTFDESSMVGCVLAASRPDLVRCLTLYAPRVTGRRTVDFPWQPTPEEWDWYLARVAEDWGTDAYSRLELRTVMPSGAARPESIAVYSRYLRNAASPASALALISQYRDTDIREVLSSVRVPTVILRHRDDPSIPLDAVAFMAARIAGAQIEEVDGPDSTGWFAGDIAGVADAVARNVTGAPSPVRTDDRHLATVLFTDVVGSTVRASALGDKAWHALLERHYERVRAQLARYRGREVDTAGDGFFATFAGPAVAVRCALAIGSAMRDLDIEVRAGVHTGEVETIDGKDGGLAVHIGARIAGLAGPSEVLVSSTVRDLVAGSELRFDSIGEHELKGVPDRWRLFRASA